MSDPCPFGVCDGSGFVTDEATNTDTPCKCRPLRIGQAGLTHEAENLLVGVVLEAMTRMKPAGDAATRV